MLGKIHPQYFPSIFGREGNLPLDKEIVTQKFTQLAQDINSVTKHTQTPEQVAAGFIAIAVENMANAIKKISLQRGYDITKYTLCCFGGAGAQVACLIADTLGMKKIFLHPYAGVLSAYGMGLADIRATRVSAVEQPLTPATIPQLQQLMTSLITQAKTELTASEDSQEQIVRKLNLKYDGSNSTLSVDFASNITSMQQEFETEHKSRYGFIQTEKTIIIESATVELIQTMDTPSEPQITRTRPPNHPPTPTKTVQMFATNQWQNTPIYHRENLQPQDQITTRHHHRKNQHNHHRTQLASPPHPQQPPNPPKTLTPLSLLSSPLISFSAPLRARSSASLRVSKKTSCTPTQSA